ncbi:MAG: hypothetical protein C0507_19065 [Cyanobacteria bacterium PR.3.49]|nr:hypothetical protein [Cyanobacteria bacterium PR.3.49]
MRAGNHSIEIGTHLFTMHPSNDVNVLRWAKNDCVGSACKKVFVRRNTMFKTGFARPGALQMLVATVAIALCSTFPPVIAAFKPSHEWLLVLTGIPAFLMIFAGLMMFIVYGIGFLRYCADKGYSKWLGLVLLLGAVPGFLVLLMLPDLKHAVQEMNSDRNLRHAH